MPWLHSTFSSKGKRTRTDKITMDISGSDIQVTDNDNVAIENNLSSIPALSEGDSQSGIDIRKALDILSSRSPNNHLQRPPPPELKNMGQIIDIFAPSSDLPQSSTESMTRNETITPTSTAVNPVEQRQKIRDTLKSLSFIPLLKTVLTAQEDRVRTYRLYDEALAKVLISNQLTDYPPACVAATAAFAVLSNTVSAVRDELWERADSKKDMLIPTSTSSSVIKLIKDLQESERQKLQLTAAYHLEQIRANNLLQSNCGNSGDNDDSQEVYMREMSLLNNGIADLRSQIETSRSEINSIIDDLRCLLVEQMEVEEEE